MVVAVLRSWSCRLGSEIFRVARLGVGQMAFSCWTCVDESERIGESVSQVSIVLKLAEARIDDGHRLQDIGVLVELQIQRVGDARVGVELG